MSVLCETHGIIHYVTSSYSVYGFNIMVQWKKKCFCLIW